MSFWEKLICARSHIIFVVALVFSFWLSYNLENIASKKFLYKIDRTLPELVKRGRSDLSDVDLLWGKVAWQYFKNNTIEETGLVNSVDGFTASTMWDTSSYMMGLISAYKLSIIEEKEFDTRVIKVLKTLAKIPLFDEKLPNKSYNTVTLQMVDYTNNATEKGIGWSAIDIGRVLVPLNMLIWSYPKYQPLVKRIIAAWDFDALLKEGVMYGAELKDNGNIKYVQEGRLGYEEYASKSLMLMGFDVSVSAQYFDYLNMVEIDGVEIATDSRRPEIYHAHNYVVSEPYILDGIEYGWDYVSEELAYRVYDVQKKRYERTGIMTAVSEDNIDVAPYFVYNTVFTDGKEWNAITESGDDASSFKSLSVKSALGWSVLYEDDYAKKLIEELDSLYDEKKGWYSGRYEKTGKANKAITANTNGIILEVLAYKKFGPLVKSGLK